MRSFLKTSESLRKFPSNRAGTRSLRLARNPQKEDLAGELSHALKEATRSRTRLTRLLPKLFGPKACCPDKEAEARRRWDEEGERVIKKVYRELEAAAAGVPIEEEAPPLEVEAEQVSKEKRSPLESKEYASLSEEKQAVLKAEYDAWQAWERVLQTAKEAFETQHPKWDESNSPESASLRHLWSLYRQALLGLSGSGGKEGLLTENSESKGTSNCDADHKQYLADGIKIWGEPPEGVPVLEHIIRSQVLASAGLDPMQYYRLKKEEEELRSGAPNGAADSPPATPPK